MKSIGELLVIAVCVCVGSHGGVARAAEIRLGNMKAERILFLGNSITACPPNWWGLSASTAAKDYAHLLVGAIDAKTGGSLTTIPTTAPITNPDGSVDFGKSNVINIADVFERGYASYNAAKLSKQLAWKADIVVLQFGENIPPAAFNADIFKNSLKTLLADLKASSNPHIFMPGYILGANATIDEMKRNICAEDPTHRVFVDLSSVGKDPSNMGAHGHPGDKGMALIAETLFKAILAHSAATTANASAAETEKDAGK
jgi:lysophospholipase L1-like esterase